MRLRACRRLTIQLPGSGPRRAAGDGRLNQLAARSRAPAPAAAQRSSGRARGRVGRPRGDERAVGGIPGVLGVQPLDSSPVQSRARVLRERPRSQTVSEQRQRSPFRSRLPNLHHQTAWRRLCGLYAESLAQPRDTNPILGETAGAAVAEMSCVMGANCPRCRLPPGGPQGERFGCVRPGNSVSACLAICSCNWTNSCLLCSR